MQDTMGRKKKGKRDSKQKQDENKPVQSQVNHLRKQFQELAEHMPQMLHKHEQQKQVASVKGALKHYFIQKLLHQHFMQVVHAYLD